MSKKVIFTDRSNELLNSYLKDISKYKILEGPEIAKLVLEAQEGNEKSKNKVVQSNLRFVVTIAKQFQHRGIDLMDLIAAGNEGLIKAVDKFNDLIEKTDKADEIFNKAKELKIRVMASLKAVTSGALDL